MIKIKALNSIKKHLAIIIFIALYIVISLLTYKDFGITWDESFSYNRGVSSYQHIFNKIVKRPFAFNKKNGHLDIRKAKSRFTSFKRYMKMNRKKYSFYLSYSGFYPMILFVLNKNKTIEIYHLLNMLFSLGIFIALYSLLYSQYKDQKKAILGPIFLFLTPRFIGHIPGNPKDIPFAVMYFISCTAIYFFAPSKRVLTKILVMGLLFGLTQNLRIAGITLYGIIALFDTYTFYLEKQKKPGESGTWAEFLIKEIQTIILIGIVAMFLLVLTWPYLGIDLISNVRDMCDVGRHFPWKGKVVYQGQLLKGEKLPGNYLLTWFAIATPLIILIPALLSPFVIKKRFQNKMFVLLIITLVTNITLYTIIRPLIYDGLRHFLFIVAIVSSLGVMTIIEYFKNTKQKLRKICIFIIILINIIALAKQIITLHPYQYIFFNSLVGGLQGAYKKYDTEYWGASYNEAINWFKKNIATDKNKIYKIHIGGIGHYKIYQARNIKNVPFKRAEYIFLFTRRMKEEPKKENIIHIVQRDNTPLVFIEKNKNVSSSFTMEWGGDALEILKKVPERFFDFVVKNSESFAHSKGYAKVTRKSLAEQMKK